MEKINRDKIIACLKRSQEGCFLGISVEMVNKWTGIPSEETRYFFEQWEAAGVLGSPFRMGKGRGDEVFHRINSIPEVNNDDDLAAEVTRLKAERELLLDAIEQGFGVACGDTGAWRRGSAESIKRVIQGHFEAYAHGTEIIIQEHEKRAVREALAKEKSKFEEMESYAARLKSILLYCAERWGCNPAWDDMVRSAIASRPEIPQAATDTSHATSEKFVKESREEDGELTDPLTILCPRCEKELLFTGFNITKTLILLECNSCDLFYTTKVDPEFPRV